MVKVDWDDIFLYVKKIHKDVDEHLKGENRTLRCVVGLLRGGLIPGVMLSHRLGVPLIPLQWQTRDNDQKIDPTPLVKEILNCSSHETCLIVDDIVDSGKTFQDINDYINLLQRHCNMRWIFATLIKKTNLDFDVISGCDLNDDSWIVFPWEYGNR